MTPEARWVPFPVLNARSHSAPARLLWILIGRQEPTDDLLHDLSGLDRRTIAKARQSLAQAQLPSCFGRPTKGCACMPMALLTAEELSVGARLLYGQLQGVPTFAEGSGSFTYAALSQLTGTCADSLRRAVAELAQAGWLTTSQAHRKAPIHFTRCDPVAALLRARISAIRRKIKSASYRGEALLKEFLNAMVALDDYAENATPDFLPNPFTGELMELDRYYPSARVGIEFNGDQHYDNTDLTLETETVKQIGRDAMKAYLCQARGVTLVTFRPEDMTCKAIATKLPQQLPWRHQEGLEPLLTALEAMAADYRVRTAEERLYKSKDPRRSGGLALKQEA